jgi:hypothetical protein
MVDAQAQQQQPEDLKTNLFVFLSDGTRNKQ